ncbi:ABC transporter substrate-binding protein [Conexibacter stalactiti]|uniref:ABC transporter substrate-binding protein n=1 Tax=Conexibacter stalactiti TaxID=1940611 RepID=A0ABU4HNL5_9ACTN|nr:ABC transporter substrate-binding protein [Conexibacter stalactiti]MDW5594867.1 ABC transporter substrate-binding protein [Conexibacter stalactiti]MEC5035509.1 ABC transporter substrate-binding protein [Conexibacter stalactiti]
MSRVTSGPPRSSRPRRRTLRAALAAPLLAAALFVAACGEEKADSSTAADAAPAATSTTATGAGGTASGPLGDAARLAAAYVGGTPGRADASLKPVKIGFINTQGGVEDDPDATATAQAAVDLVNEQLGGIEGHPLELETCFVVNAAEDNQACAQRFAADDDVAVVQIGMGSALDPIYTTLRGRRAILGGLAIEPSSLVAPAVFYTPGAARTGTTMAQFAKDRLDARKVAFVYGGDERGVQALAPAFEDLGMTYTAASMGEEGAQLNAALVATKAKDADAIVFLGSGATCAQLEKTKTSLGIDTPVIGTDLCASREVAEALGDYPRWNFIYQSANYNDPSNPEVAAVQAAMEEYQSGVPYSLIFPFGNTLALAKIFNELGVDALTFENVERALRAFEGPVFAGPQRLACGSLAAEGQPALCSPTAIVSSYVGDDVWEDNTP